MLQRCAMRIWRAAAVLALLSGAATLALAQCPMCRTAVESNPEIAGALNTGIIVLLTPAVALFTGVFFVAFRYHNSPTDDEREESEE